MILVNFIGQPGSGKSTMAAGVFHALKKSAWNVELITEYTKELIFQNDQWSLSDELLVFSEKYKRIKRMQDVDIVITDSSLINSVVYGKLQFGSVGSDFFMHISKSFDSLYFVVEPKTKYIPFGRMPDENMAKAAGDEIIKLLKDVSSPVWTVPGDDSSMEGIVKLIEGSASVKGYKKYF